MTAAARIDLAVMVDGAALDEAASAAIEAASTSGAKFSSAVLKGLYGDVATSICDRLRHLDFLSLLAQGWGKAIEFNNAPASGSHSVALGRHAIDTDVHPAVTIECGGVAIETVEFTLRLSATFTAVKLTVVDRRLTSAEIDGFDLGAELLYNEHILADKKTWKHFDLPGVHAFKPPIALPALSRSGV